MTHLTSCLTVLVWGLLLSAPLLAQSTSDPNAAGDDQGPVSREEYNRVVEEVAELRADLDTILEGGDGDAAPARLPGYKGGLYDKPFLQGVGSRVYGGGYFDVEYRDEESQDHEFRFHRLIPFIYADIHERIRFATEIEIEDGSDVAIEFAYLDLLLLEQVNFRGGVILDPLGKFNLIHDSPINDLTDRPLVSRFVIPSTLREVGMGLFGTLTPPESAWEVKYEAYVTGGYKGLSDDGDTTITSGDGLRDARPHRDELDTRKFDDINGQFAGVGRLSVSPVIGSEFGVSAHGGTYDESDDNFLTIGAVDGLVTVPQFTLGEVPVGPIEIQGEAAYAWIERNSFARSSGVAGDMWGYYLQTGYHFMPKWLQKNAPALFWTQSTFTLVGRWDQVDLDGNKLRRWTVGLNYRPIESTVFKIDYQFNQGKGSAPDDSDDDALVISLASYF